MSHHDKWEPVIGLEIHVELNTKSKLFSSAPNRFGDEPNTNISVVCTGQPGALPVLNKEAVRKAVQFGLAVGAKVAPYSKFDRKSYFYPDSPRNFQITQFDEPIVIGGSVIAEVGEEEKTFQIEHAHLEDDAGMLKHFSKFAGVDYNRAGVPLIEIVSEPCIRSPKEAAAYAMAIKAIMEYIDASDCNMEEGSLRFDANVSVRLKGETGLRPKTEIKNMNSFNFLEKAIAIEIGRQIALYEKNPDKDPKELIKQSTYRWDPEKQDIVLMRTKEAAADYRYFPEPDLPPIILSEAYIKEVEQTLPELPFERLKRYVASFELPKDLAFILTSDKKLADYFEEALKVTDEARALCNWMVVEFTGRVKESGKNLWELGIEASHIGNLVNLIKNKVITGKIAKKVADDMVASPGKDPETIVKENPDYQPMHDEGELESVVDKVLAANEASVADFQSGKERAFKFLMGQIMKETKGKASPEIVRDLLLKKLQSKV